MIRLLFICLFLGLGILSADPSQKGVSGIPGIDTLKSA